MHMKSIIHKHFQKNVKTVKTNAKTNLKTKNYINNEFRLESDIYIEEYDSDSDIYIEE